MTVFPYGKAHFIGIGGVGMSATALMLRDSGVAVTGSDEAVYPPISDVLAAEKLDFRTPYAPGNIPEGVDLVVIGKNAKLVPETNAEVAAVATYVRNSWGNHAPEVSARQAGEMRHVLNARKAAVAVK